MERRRLAKHKHKNSLDIKPKQRKFCEAYILNGHNVSQAAAEAGICRTSANLLLQKSHIQAEMENYMEAAKRIIYEKFGNTFLLKMTKLMEIAQSDYKNNSGDDREVAASDVISAIREMNAMEGHLAPTKNMNLNASIHIDEKRFFDLYLENMKEL